MISTTYTGAIYDSSSSTSTTESSDDALGQDAFLKMFLAQVTNQDPLNPMDNTEFTAQLATFSQLEQLTNINESLEGLWRMESAIQQNTILGFVGREVTINGTQIPVSDGVAGTTSFLLENTADVRVVITDESGVTIRTEELGFLTQGRNEFTWDGKDMWGEAVPDGTYTVTISASDHATGDPVTVSDTTVSALVTGYEVDDSGNMYLIMGGAAVPAGDILGVRAPSTATTTDTSDTSEDDTTDDDTTILEDALDALANAASAAASLLI